jgi:hypothetical protein
VGSVLDLLWSDPSFRLMIVSAPTFVLFRTDSEPVGVMMAAKIEKLARGDPIYPPCDRCRRLKFECTKHLTACSACTKKHAKCSWKDIKEGERSYSRILFFPLHIDSPFAELSYRSFATQIVDTLEVLGVVLSLLLKHSK